MPDAKRNLQLYRSDPKRMARDQALNTRVSRCDALGQIEHREISLYALRTISGKQLNDIWPYLPEPAPKIDRENGLPVPPPCRVEGGIHPALSFLFAAALGATGLVFVALIVRVLLNVAAMCAA